MGCIFPQNKKKDILNRSKISYFSVFEFLGFSQKFRILTFSEKSPKSDFFFWIPTFSENNLFSDIILRILSFWGKKPPKNSEVRILTFLSELWETKHTKKSQAQAFVQWPQSSSVQIPINWDSPDASDKLFDIIWEQLYGCMELHGSTLHLWRQKKPKTKQNKKACRKVRASQ